MSLLSSRVPMGLKLLLTAIAVADDLGAILIIAFFYTDHLSLPALAVAALALLALIALNRLRVLRLSPYLLIGAVLWVAMLKSGVHATLAGVALGFTIPLSSGRGSEEDGQHRPLEILEHGLHPWVAYGILPLFAFANAGVPLAGLSLASLAAPVPLGVALGLFAGKQIGIFGSALLLIGLGLARRPPEVSWASLYGMSILCGIGFTMSLFIGSLAFEAGHVDMLVLNRVGILSGSLIAAVVGFVWLWVSLPKAQSR